jgi:hypothetical protein
MISILDFGPWKGQEFHLAINLLNKIKNKECTPLFEQTFDWNTMKIAYNNETEYVYLYDDYGNMGLDNNSFDNLIHLINSNGESID